MEKIEISNFLKSAKIVDEVFSEVCIEYGEEKALSSFFKDDIYEINDDFPFEHMYNHQKKDGITMYLFRRKKDRKYFKLITYCNNIQGDFLYERNPLRAVNMQ